MMLQWFKVISKSAASVSETFELHSSIAYDSMADFIEAMMIQIVEAEDEMYRDCYGYRGTEAVPVPPYEVPLKELERSFESKKRYYTMIALELEEKDRVLAMYEANINCHKALDEGQ